MAFDLLERSGPPGASAQVLREVGETRPLEVFTVDETWCSYAQLRAVLEAVGRIFGDPGALYLAGADVDLVRSTAPDVTELIQSLDGPGVIYASLAGGHSHISTILEHDPEEVGPTEWIVRSRLTDGHDAFPEYCALTSGILAMSPRLFGFANADVVEETCRRRGDEWCSHRVRWTEADDAEQRATYYEQRARLFETRFSALRQRLDDLVSGDDVDEVLGRIIKSASSAVHVPAFVLVIDPLPGVEHRVLSFGLDEAETAAIVDELRDPDRVPRRDLLVAEIESSRRCYGRLAAVDLDGVALLDEVVVLDSYARLAATALDSATAIAESRNQAERATALLELSTALAATATTHDVAVTLARAVPRVLGIDIGIVGLYDETTGLVTVEAITDVDALGEALLMGATFDDDEVQRATELGYLDEATADPRIAALMSAAGLVAAATVPIIVDGAYAGSISAGVRSGPERVRATPELRARFAGLTAQASTALRNVRLLERIQHQAAHDALTGLPNRTLVLERLERLGKTGMALFIDLDGFKDVNDTLGHAAGDHLLTAVADRLRLAVRDTDVLGRIGGDEFIIAAQSGSPEALADRVLAILREPFVLEGHQHVPLRISASIGVAHASHGSAADVLRNADVALYQAKAAGKDRYLVYEPAMQHAARARLVLDAELRTALAERQLFLQYQPILDLATEQIVAVEALLRWQHPERGLVPPSEFIPQLEASGLIVDVGRWVLQDACAQMARWHAEGLDLGLSVNASTRQLENTWFVDDVRAALRASGLRASALTIEITETSIMLDPIASTKQLARIKDLGVKLAIDDFGTGYSSLAYLRQFPVDVLKIDRSFVSAIGSSHESAALIRAMVQLGKGLGLETLAEGIEERSQLEHLREQGCDSAQGFLFSRPVDPDVLAELVRSCSSSSSSWTN